MFCTSWYHPFATGITLVSPFCLIVSYSVLVMMSSSNVPLRGETFAFS